MYGTESPHIDMLVWCDALRQRIDNATAHPMLFCGPCLGNPESGETGARNVVLCRVLGAEDILLGALPSPSDGGTNARPLPVPRGVSCCCRSGQHLIVFLERGPLYLVAVSRAGEPKAALLLQLDLLHAHFLAILTDSFEKTLAKNPRFEPRRLLGATLEPSSVPSYARQIMSPLLLDVCLHSGF